jgi:uncharacterized membrane protein YozB (DUF420 family)
MLWIHPIWQVSTIFLALYVFYLGWTRFSATTLGHTHPFQWKRHVALGKAAIYMWIYGALVGLSAAWIKWHTFGVTGAHFKLGMIIVILAIFGYWSGLHMDNHKKKRKVLPLIHGAGNVLLLLCALFSIGTGTRVILTLIK